MTNTTDETKKIELKDTFLGSQFNITDENFLSDITQNLNASYIDMTKKVIEGEIIDYDKKRDTVHLDLGLKYEGRVSGKEFFTAGDRDNIKIGNKVKVYLEDLDKHQNHIKVSREKAIREESWERIVEAFNNQEPIECIPFAPSRSGVVVDINAIIGFLPKSQIEFFHGMDESSILNKKTKVMIIHCDEKQRNIVVSVKGVMDLANKDVRDELLNNLKEGDVIEGRVKNITPYGSFISINNCIDGLLHINDISWSKIGHPAEVVKIGQTIKVKVLRIVKKSEKDIKISLGLKQTQDNPWGSFAEENKVGSIVSGKITSITNYGLFVSIAPDIEGLVHVSELKWKSEADRNLKDDYEIGQEIQAKILDINLDKHRISLGIKQLEDNPWDEFINTNQIGSIITGKVVNITDFGLFVSLNDKIDGLISINDIAYGGAENYLPSTIKVGDTIDAVYIEGDAKSQRIRLGIKQLFEKRISDIESSLVQDAVVDCKVLNVKYNGIFVSAFDGAMTCYIKSSEISQDFLSSITPGSSVKAMVVSYAKDYKKLVLSVSKYEEKFVYGTARTASTIGDIMQ